MPGALSPRAFAHARPPRMQCDQAPFSGKERFRSKIALPHPQQSIRELPEPDMNPGLSNS